jgi:hypothetical protein
VTRDRAADNCSSPVAADEVTNFGPNPGARPVFMHALPNLPDRHPLLVVLHGCTRSAASDDFGADSGKPIVRETAMNEDALNASVRKFLKKLGVTAQREIETAVRDASAQGRLSGSKPLPAKAVVTLGGVDLRVEIDGDIEFA